MMKYQTFENRVSKLEANKQIPDQKRYYEIGCGIIELSNEPEGHLLRNRIIEWTNITQNEPFDVILGGIYHILSKYPKYLILTHLDNIPDVIDEDSKRILIDRYQIRIPSPNPPSHRI